MTFFSRDPVPAATALAAAAFVGAALFYVLAGSEVRQANQTRERTLQLAGELRASSEQLTRMARSYVATGAPAFRLCYDTVLAE